MRSSIAVAAGLAAVASAYTSTITVTDDVTITSCEPSVTDCPYKGGSTWADWTSTTTSPVAAVTTTSTSSSHDPWADWTSSSSSPAAPVTTSTSSGTHDPWADWTSSTTVAPVTTTTSAGCGTFTGTAPPAWFSQLPASVLSSIEAKWTGAPPADWCYYSYSTTTLASTPVAPVSSAPYWPASSSPVSPASGTGVWSYTPSSTPVSPEVATFTGAANANTGSLAFAGIVAAAAMIIA